METVKSSWNALSDEYFEKNKIDMIIKKNISNPSALFHPDTYILLKKHCNSLRNKRVCVLASGDNQDALAFSLLGAKVTSVDISENQLSNAKKIADSFNLNIEFICNDIMDLSVIEEQAFDIVYTSNGVFVWVDDLNVLFKEIYRVLDNKGLYIFREVHPFQRPWKDKLVPIEMEKSYYDIGPFGQFKNYHWKVEDIINSLVKSGLIINEIKESKSVDDSFWESPDFENRNRMTEKLQEWENNNLAGLPVWIGMVCIKSIQDNFEKRFYKIPS